MSRRILVLLLPCLLVAPLWAARADERVVPDPVGVWRGELQRGVGAGEKPWQLVLRIRRDAAGFSATLEGFDTISGTLGVQNLTLVEDVLSFQVPATAGRFAGNFYGDSLRGTWVEGEEARRLIFFRD